ncbi:UDP-2,3-diacylglucosamine diphosphatase [Rhodocaloribacter litoris]|uniref:UDP-2,3-diacylglucosamine diphosphatase n=1 Tax=Rhodocaloribacter litoris TaxID=2558931 RepID=UPI00142116DB|nr:UDP-2,3-diacylglucosamine diphosphatase [Rhodocaloribacter litoris]QXD15875.1 UDP-2,3-diacylglucosamine diphosphatase [Rhodocaloribacter litoris]
MILFISDIHFGRAGAATERLHEQELVACLRACETAVEGLYLVGDVFDAYIEYRHLVPKGFVRFQALLAEWTGRGVPVTYLVGNHDPWHRDYFASELGVRVVFDALHEPLFGRNVYMAHGDGLAPADRLQRRLRPILRHPVPVRLYRTLLPGDLGLGLARWVKNRFGHQQVSEETITGLREHARRILATTPAELVILGHSHHPEQVRWPEGDYLNLGSWRDERTFGLLDERGPRLMRWNGTCPVAFNPRPSR